jgi:hypothetical protein
MDYWNAVNDAKVVDFVTAQLTMRYSTPMERRDEA